MTKKLLSAEALSTVLRKVRRNRKIVFTNGCFDLMHVGHVRLLNKAKKLGDILVLGLNSDRSVKKLKGPLRPLIPQKGRAEILSALSCVDFVVIFDEETPADIIRRIKPDILVKGGDYKIADIVGREDAKRVVRVPLVPGFSTSRLIEKILKAYGPAKP